MRRSLPSSVDRLIEPLLAMVVAGGMTYTMIHLFYRGYLPQPYFYDPFDVFMDWFNTAEWARDIGAYDAWGTVYAPLTLVVIRFFGDPRCYDGGSLVTTSYYARSCDWLGILFLHAFYLLDIFLIARIFMKVDRKTALPRAFALAAGMPLTTALERGNIIIIAFACLMLAHGPLLKSARLRWLALGLAINFKLYMLASLFPYLVRRRWRWFEGALVTTTFIYILTLLLYGQGTPFQIYENVIGYTDGQAGALLDIWYTATYAPHLQLLENFPLAGQTGSQVVDIAYIFFTGSLRITQLAILLATAAAWLRPEVVSMPRLVTLGLSFALVSVESGGYTPMFIMFFAFMERREGFFRTWAIIVSYILCFQFDLAIDDVPPLVHDTYFGGTNEIVTYYITAGPFIRPFLFYSIPFVLSCETIGQVWMDIRQQGWQTRWRFRHDLPILIGFGEAQQPPRKALDGDPLNARV